MRRRPQTGEPAAPAPLPGRTEGVSRTFRYRLTELVVRTVRSLPAFMATS